MQPLRTQDERMRVDGRERVVAAARKEDAVWGARGTRGLTEHPTV